MAERLIEVKDLKVQFATEDELRPGDLITYGDEATTHIAFWLGDGRILHSTERDDVACVLEEPEPADLRARRRALVRLR